MKPKAKNLIHKQQLQYGANALASLAKGETVSDMTVHVSRLKAAAYEFKGDDTDVEFLRGVNEKAHELEEAWEKERILEKDNEEKDEHTK